MLKILSLHFQLVEGSFQKKFFLNLYIIILFSFPLGGCIDEVVDNRTNYQGYKYICFLQYHSLAVIHFMNGEGSC